jgi:hypothetical protein
VVTSAEVSVKLLPQASVAVATAKTGVAGQSIVLGPGSAAITGGVMSRTLIVWLAVLEFPYRSVAVHVRVTLWEPAHCPAVVASTNVSVGLASHASLAVAVAKLGAAGQSIVLGAGSAAITGASLSITITCCVQVAFRPCASVTVQVTVLIPTG